MKNKIGIITFHHSYNCGSMMQAFALQNVINMMGIESEIIDFSNLGQKRLYGVFFPNNSIKNVVKNLILFPHREQIINNNLSYEAFMKSYMKLSSNSFSTQQELNDDEYFAVVAGSDQIWNITIDDADDAYFLNWVKQAHKIAYAPSFGARKISDYTKDINKYKNYLKDFLCLSIRENNGRKWIKELLDIDVPVLLDPTLLLDEKDYEGLISNTLSLPDNYIFYYAPHYEKRINDLVISISKKYNMPVIAFNAKTFFVKGMERKGFILPEVENPSIYLELIKRAGLVITTSFHGTVFSSIFRKKFWVVKNGGMLTTDDRVFTMTDMLDLNDRVISIEFEEEFDYLKSKNYELYSINLNKKRLESKEYLSRALLGAFDE